MPREHKAMGADEMRDVIRRVLQVIAGSRSRSNDLVTYNVRDYLKDTLTDDNTRSFQLKIKKAIEKEFPNNYKTFKLGPRKKNKQERFYKDLALSKFFFPTLY